MSEWILGRRLQLVYDVMTDTDLMTVGDLSLAKILLEELLETTNQALDRREGKSDLQP